MVSSPPKGGEVGRKKPSTELRERGTFQALPIHFLLLYGGGRRLIKKGAAGKKFYSIPAHGLGKVRVLVQSGSIAE